MSFILIGFILRDTKKITDKMNPFNERIKKFSECKNIAVAGVSRKPATETGNVIYKKLKDSGYNVFAVNPNAVEVEGDKCYPNLQSIPSPVDAVVINTSPKATMNVLKDCKEANVKLAWIHSSIGNGSYHNEAEKFCEANGIELIPRGCPMMYIGNVDFPHKCLKGILKLTGKIPFGM